jgi:hypothetical protein
MFISGWLRPAICPGVFMNNPGLVRRTHCPDPPAVPAATADGRTSQFRPQDGWPQAD